MNLLHLKCTYYLCVFFIFYFFLTNISLLTGTSGVQARVHDFVKKLHPNVFRLHLQSIRNFVKSTSGDKKSKRGELASSQPSTSPNEFDSSVNSRVRRENLNLPLEQHRKKGRKVQNFANDGGLKSKPSEMDLPVPDVVIQTDNEKSTSPNTRPCYEASTLGANLQLMVEVENPPRNKSPVTVQEWVDSLPVNPVETSRLVFLSKNAHFLKIIAVGKVEKIYGFH